MTLPQRLTLVRHGQSEANIAQHMVKIDQAAGIPAEFANRHDSLVRLSKLGTEQAQATGDWLRSENSSADRFYVSPHVRTRETAANLQLEGEWFVDDRFRERDWGEVFSHVPMDRETKRVRNLHEYYWKPMGGESLATGVRLRVESIMDSLYRRQGIQHTLAVGHGELLRMFQVVIERLAPEEFLAFDGNPEYKIHNTMVIQYSTVDPNAKPKSALKRILDRFTGKGEVASTRYRWRRAVCPWDRALDWDNGEWVNIDARKHSDKDLMSYAEKFEPMLANIEL